MPSAAVQGKGPGETWQKICLAFLLREELVPPPNASLLARGSEAAGPGPAWLSAHGMRDHVPSPLELRFLSGETRKWNR